MLWMLPIERRASCGWGDGDERSVGIECACALSGGRGCEAVLDVDSKLTSDADGKSARIDACLAVLPMPCMFVRIVRRRSESTDE